jgi:hypothetical protein
MMSESEDLPVRLDIRLSGNIHRYHTWPTVGQQTIADHSWQILRIYLCVADEIDPHMVQHICFHDIGETYIGDLPYPVKSENHMLKTQLDRMEQVSHHSQLNFWGAFKTCFLTDNDKLLFKQIELIEMAEFGLDQLCLGNSYGLIVANRCLRVVYEQNPCVRLVEYVKKRLGLFFMQIKFKPIDEKLGEWWNIEKWEEKKNVCQ